MKTEWTSDIYEAGNDYDQTKIIGIEGGEDDLVEMTESEVAMLVNAVDNPSGKMPTTTHIVTARRISEIISGVWSKIKNALGKKVDKVAGKGLSTNDFTNSYKSKLDGLDNELSKKVDKVAGKGLSSNDFTTAYVNKVNESYAAMHTHINKAILDNTTAAYTTDDKNKLAALPTIDEIDTAIAEGIEAWGAYKKPETGIPENDLSQDVQDILAKAETDITQSQLDTALLGKVDKVEGKGLSTNDYTAADKATVDNAAAVIPPTATAQNKLATMADLADFGGFEVVSSGQDGKPDVQNPKHIIIYLVKDSTATGSDKYKKWIYDTNDEWELIGDTSIDLAGYWHGTPTVSGQGDIITGIDIGDGGVPVITKTDDYILVPKPTQANTLLYYDGTNISWVQLSSHTFDD